MKAEHHIKKKLETNALADFANQMMQTAKEGPSQKVWIVGGVLVLVAALVFAFVYFSTRSKDTDADRWEKWNQLALSSKDNRLEELRNFVKENPGTPQARLARFQIARQLMQGTQKLGDSLTRAAGVDEVTEARKIYTELITEARDDPKLVQEALLNAGKASEALCDFDAAKKHYEQLVKEHPKSVYAHDAEKALARLKADEDKDGALLKKLASK